MMHGTGIMHYGRGDKYEGLWRNHVREGLGIYTCESANWVYEGWWRAGKRHGGDQDYVDVDMETKKEECYF